MTQTSSDISKELQSHFAGDDITCQVTRDGVPTVWVVRDSVKRVLRYLKEEVSSPYRMLYDLTAIDERHRRIRNGRADCDFSLVYHLLSFERNEDVRVKVPLMGEFPSADSIVDLWPAANWYEREVWDMFGIGFSGHPNLRRILMPPTWNGHPLRKEHPARGD